MRDARPLTWDDQAEARLIKIEPQYIISLAEHVVPLLEKAIERSDGKWGVYDLIAQCLQGHMTLWVVIKRDAVVCAGITQILRFPKKTVCGIPFVGGTHIAEWLPFESQIMEWAKPFGATELEGYDVRAASFMRRWSRRAPWLRTLIGWEPKYLVIRKLIP